MKRRSVTYSANLVQMVAGLRKGLEFVPVGGNSNPSETENEAYKALAAMRFGGYRGDVLVEVRKSNDSTWVVIGTQLWHLTDGGINPEAYQEVEVK